MKKLSVWMPRATEMLIIVNVTGKQSEFVALLNPANKPLTQIVQDDSFMEFEFRQYLFACQSKLLFKLNRPFEVASRGYLFIIIFSKSLAQHEVSNISASLNLLPWLKPSIWPSVPPDASFEVFAKEKRWAVDTKMDSVKV
ncbi:trafficking protein particle complex II-specific subunit 130 homolog isoform X1 [Pistacia vera]|uniref:trafficking protein particle complex II-specific subunit 130 homolog isoform X1 n=1 Tax=Pistacia vera TaxID=55513 RepID=UPI00126382DF|nr:trafficking protein particle complex II-specific subunit 130 homolog isoform X1 [Pistacia vera]